MLGFRELFGFEGFTVSERGSLGLPTTFCRFGTGDWAGAGDCPDTALKVFRAP